MTNERTAAVHRSIEALAARTLDEVTRSPAAIARATMPASPLTYGQTIDALIASGVPDKGGTLRNWDGALSLAVMNATIMFAAFGGISESPNFDWRGGTGACLHYLVDDDPETVYVFSITRRTIACPQCWEATGLRPAVNPDNRCDVCYERATSVISVSTANGRAVWIFNIGDCCRELLDYAKPAAEIDNPKLRRNEPCPCGSGRRVKHCHGR